jgi:RNA polymerase sigma-70 factor (ECF subfamily)
MVDSVLAKAQAAFRDKESLWLTRARCGDDAAFTRLVEAYQRPVFNLCYRMLGDAGEAEDAAQETFIRVYTRLASYDPERKFLSWLLAIASHYCIDRLRQRRYSLVSWDALSLYDRLLRPNPQLGPEEVALRHEVQCQAQALLEALPPDYRAVVVLRYWHELSYREIAETLTITLPAVKSRLFRARHLMVQMVAQTEAESAKTQARPSESLRVKKDRDQRITMVKACPPPLKPTASTRP